MMSLFSSDSNRVSEGDTRGVRPMASRRGESAGSVEDGGPASSSASTSTSSTPAGRRPENDGGDETSFAPPVRGTSLASMVLSTSLQQPQRQQQPPNTMESSSSTQQRRGPSSQQQTQQQQQRPKTTTSSAYDGLSEEDRLLKERARSGRTTTNRNGPDPDLPGAVVFRGIDDDQQIDRTTFSTYSSNSSGGAGSRSSSRVTSMRIGIEEHDATLPNQSSVPDRIETNYNDLDVSNSDSNKHQSNMDPNYNDINSEYFRTMDGTPLVEAHLVEESSTRSGRRNDNDFGSDWSSTVVTATRDTYWSRLKTSRTTQVGLALTIILALLLSIAIALLVNQPPKTVTNQSSDNSDDEILSDEKEIYIQLGEDLDGVADLGGYGAAVATCSDGSKIAVATPMFGHSVVSVYVMVINETIDVLKWEKLGDDIAPGADDPVLSAGDAFVARSETSVAFSPDCNVVAIGSPWLGPNAAGRVDTYEWSNTTEQWELLGGTLYGEELGEEFGQAVALSATGRILAVGVPGYTNMNEPMAGRVSIFQLETETDVNVRNSYNPVWRELGEPLSGTTEYSMMGISVALSHSGHVVAAGLATPAVTKSSDISAQTAARAFQFVSRASTDRHNEQLVQEWIELGEGAIESTSEYDTAWIVSLSADGFFMVQSNFYLDDNGLSITDQNDAIFVIASAYHSTLGRWVRMGSNIHTNSTGQKSGYVVAVSEDGSRIGMGDPGQNNPEGESTGHVHLYEYFMKEDAWCQIGPNYYGKNPGDQFGYSIAISGDANRMIVGAPRTRVAAGSTFGRVRVFDINSTDVLPNCTVS